MHLFIYLFICLNGYVFNEKCHFDKKMRARSNYQESIFCFTKTYFKTKCSENYYYFFWRKRIYFSQNTLFWQENVGLFKSSRIIFCFIKTYFKIKRSVKHFFFGLNGFIFHKIRYFEKKMRTRFHDQELFFDSVKLILKWNVQ